MNYSAILASPYSSPPRVCWQVRVCGLRDSEGRPTLKPSPDPQGHYLWVPRLETWFDATLALVLHELASFLPAHHPEDAVVCIEARYRRLGGRPSPVPRPLVLDPNVALQVPARGWQAAVLTARDDRPDTTTGGPFPGQFSEPARLARAARREGLDRRVISAISCAHSITWSGFDPPVEPATPCSRTTRSTNL